MDPVSPAPHPGTTPLRPATRDDIPALAELWALAFPGDRTVEIRARELAEGGPWGGWVNCWVADSGGRLDGALRTLPLEMHLFGRPVRTLGVAAVAVAPHARRRGLGRRMCQAALRIGRDRGDLLAALHPFRVDFYTRLGFGLAGAFHRYRFAPEMLPPFPGSEGVVRLEDAEHVLPRLHQEMAPRIQGHLARSPRRWKALLEAHPLAWGIPGGGYLLGRLRRLPRGGGVALEVAELLATTPDHYRALLGWISAQRDAWRQVTLDALPGDRLHQVLADPRLPGTKPARGLWFPSATLLRGPMVRILGPGKLLAALGADPGTRLALHDELLPENQGVWSGAGEGRWTRSTTEPGSGALPVGLASTLLVEGGLPGLTLPRPGFDPLIGVADFRLLDPF